MMSVFLAGFLVTLIPGLITGWVLAGLMGWAMRRDDYCRHRVPAPVMARGIGERVSPPVAPIVVTVRVLPETALPEGWSPARVVEGRVVHGTTMTSRGCLTTR